MTTTTISIPNQIQIIGDTGNFYTLVSLDCLGDASVLQNSRIVLEDRHSGEEKEDEEEGDILVCGKCKAQYSDVEVFMHHKKTCKRIVHPMLEEAVKPCEMIEPEPALRSDVFYTVESSLMGGDPQLTQLYLDPSQLIPLEGDQALETEPETNNKSLGFIGENPMRIGEDTLGIVGDNLPRTHQNGFEVVDDRAGIEGDDASHKDNGKQSGKEAKSKKHYCSYCQKGFNKVFDLNQHTRSHTGEKPYQCVICGRGFAQKSNVKKHMATHKVWPKGHRTLPKEAAVISELDEITNNGTEGKEKELELVSSLETTQTLKETREQPSFSSSYECPYCLLTFPSFPTFKSHLKEHQTEKCYRCITPNCSKMFQDLQAFLDHTAEHKDREFRCHICSNKFSDLAQLNLHSYSHLTDEQTREKQVFKCSKCKNTYTSAEALDHHMETTPHSYTCEICDKEFSAERFLRKHIGVAHTRGLFKCHICQKKFKNESYLKSHSMIHTGEMPFECKECGTKFNRKDKLKRHTQTHNPSRKFKCPFKDHINCNKEFHRFDKLKLHIMTHGNIKPFKCDVCNNGFSRKEHLNSHMQKIHKGGKGKFSCQKCSSKFDTNALLTEHTKEVHNENTRGATNIKQNEAVTEKSLELPSSLLSSPSLPSLDHTDTFDAKYSEYQLPDHFEDSSQSVKPNSASLSLDHGFHKQESSQQSYSDPDKSREFCVQSAVGSAASEAMEILYSESGHNILLPSSEPFPLNV